MSRTSKGPRYYKSKRAWFANIGNDRILLVRGPKGATEEIAWEKYNAEIDARKVQVEGDRNMVWAVLNAFLRDRSHRTVDGLAPNTLAKDRLVITSANESFGHVIVRDLRPSHINAWLAAMKQSRWNPKLKRATRWTGGTVRLALETVRTAFRWALGEGLITVNPFDCKGKGEKVKRQRVNYKGRKLAIAEPEHEALLKQAKRRSHKDFYYLLQFLWATGARPAEIYLATADEWEEKDGAFIIKAADPKNVGRFKQAHLGEDRKVFIPDSLVPVAKALMTKYPTGPLFRTESGEPWTKATLCSRFQSTRRAANNEATKRGLSEVVRHQITAYSYRHAFVTRWIEAKGDSWHLCELIGTSLEMLRRHYSHLFERSARLREALNDFGKDVATPPRISSDPDPKPSLAS